MENIDNKRKHDIVFTHAVFVGSLAYRSSLEVNISLGK